MSHRVLYLVIKNMEFYGLNSRHAYQQKGGAPLAGRDPYISTHIQ